MKLLKRGVALLLVMTLMIVGAVSASAGRTFIYFSDVKRTDWYYGNVVEMVNCGYFQGVGGSRYQPNAPVTRAMFVTVLGRVMELEAKYYDYLSIFEDIQIGQWYSPYVNWAFAEGITTGTSITTFSPNASITREEMAVLLSRCCDALNISPAKISNPLPSFKDESKASSWARSGISLMRRTGIIRGDENQNFNPKAYATRAEATAIFDRFMSAARLRKKETGKYFPDTPVIAHAGGMIDGRDASNSLEALDATFKAGVSIIEIDFNFTSDGELACIHDWHPRFAAGLPVGAPVTLEKFLQCRIYGQYTPMWLGNLCQYLEENSGLYIVTDVKDNNIAAARKIKEEYPKLMDRFIIQVYSEAEYDAIRAMGFDQIIFSLYKMTWAEKTNTAALARFADGHKLLGYTADVTLCNVSGFVDGMKQAKIPLFLHTINSKSEQKKLFQNGVYGIYTDSLVK